ncbi:phosphotransferase family protein [Catenulispora subtropica]|uniref:Phosphotransferase family protein n=1 Tax=Catenulispora subtropica TaxID=450798 RepID=A0ABN2STM6_9ACTN
MSERSEPERLAGVVGGWLEESGIDHDGPLTLTRVGVGQSNLTYTVADATGRADRRWVLRRPPLGQLLASAHDVAREARIMTALQDSEVPVPRVFGVRTVDDVPMVLMEFVDGLVLDRREVVDAVPEAIRRAVGLAIARALALVHTVDLEKTGLIDLASHKPYAERQLKRWTTQWQHSKTRESADLETLTARLAAAVPEQRELTLVHGDFHLRNVIVRPEDGSVASVLDWELCTLGDPLADLGTLLAYWPEPGEPGAGLLSFSTLPGFPRRDEMAAAYLDASGRDGSALAFWHALGLWKIAIIAEGVLRRIQDEPRNRAAAYAPTTDQIDSLIAKALRTLR